MARLIGAVATLGAAAIAACFSTPRLRFDGGGGDDDATDAKDPPMGDGPTVDAYVSVDGNGSSCVADLFGTSSSGTCGSSGWATFTGSGSANTDGTDLSLMAFGSATAARCESTMTSSYARFTVDVAVPAATLAGDTTFVGFQSADHVKLWGLTIAYDQPLGAPAYQITCAGLGASTGSTMWDVSSHYVQIERTGNTTVDIRKSSDNKTFSFIGTCSATSGDLDSVLASVVVRTGSASSSATSKFGQIELCK